MRGLFITGTDTGVGKTALTGALTRILREEGLDIGVTKPVATGCTPTESGWRCADAEFLCKATGCRDPQQIVCTYCFEDPLAPSVAAEKAGREISLPDIDQWPVPVPQLASP